MAVDLDWYGRRGVVKLKHATPVDTGETKDGWHYKIVKDDVVFYNDNPDVVFYLCHGHLTTGGTWVAGNDFVTPIVKEIQNDIKREALLDGKRVIRRGRRRIRIELRNKR